MSTPRDLPKVPASPGGITSGATAGTGSIGFSGGASVSSDTVSQATTAAKLASAPSLDGALGAAKLGGTPAAGPGTIDSVTGGVTSRVPGVPGSPPSVPGMPGGAPSVENLAGTGTPTPPDVSTYTSSAVSPSSARGAVGVVTDAAGAGGVVTRTEAARGAAENVQATVADPAGAATSRVTSAASEAAPVDPAIVKSDSDLAQRAVDNPEAAAANQVHFGVDTHTGDGGASVQVEGGATAPTLDPTKKR